MSTEMSGSTRATRRDRGTPAHMTVQAPVVDGVVRARADLTELWTSA